MIKKAVLSYFNPSESFGNKCGFAKYSDFLWTTSLSIFCASQHFEEVQFISSDWGVDVFKELGLPITDYSTKLNEMKSVSRHFWAYGKFIAYCEQKKPFVHIDNDVFLWHPLPKRILNAKLCFQSQEPFDSSGYRWYDMLKACWEDAKVRPQVIVDNEVFDFAYNCGICGGNYLKIFKEWKACSEEYIFAPENKMLFFGKKHNKLLIHQNLFYEQYFLSSLIKHHKMRGKVEVLHENAMEINKGYNPSSPRYTHLWGTTKTDGGMMAKVRMTLFYKDRALFERLMEFCNKNKIR